MLEYSRNELSEKDLEDRIIRYPELIEEGLIYLEHQRPTTTGRLDVLFLDSNNILTIAEIKVILLVVQVLPSNILLKKVICIMRSRIRSLILLIQVILMNLGFENLFQLHLKPCQA